MKRLAFCLSATLLVTGCAQVFDANLFSGVDKYQSPSTSSLSAMKTDEIKTVFAQPGAYEDLKANPEKLDAVKTALTTAYESPTATTTEKIDAATTLVTVVSNGSGVADLKSTLVNSVTTIQDAVNKKDYVGAIKIFLGNKTEAEIAATLTNLQSMAKALAFMQTVATKPDDTVDSAVFMASAKTDKAGFAQSALMASLAQALVTDKGTIAETAAELAKDANSISLPEGNDMLAFKAAMDPPTGTTVTVTSAKSATAPNYSYAYVATIKSELPF